LSEVRPYERHEKGHIEEVRPYERWEAHKHIGLPGGLPADDLHELDDYKSTGYGWLNRALRKPGGEVPARRLARSVGLIDHAFSQAVPTAHPVVAYRGARGFLPRHLVPGSVLHDKAYMSTSTDENTARGFVGSDGKVVRITVSAGERLLSLDNMAEAGLLPGWEGSGEHEVLLPRDRDLEVTGVHGDIVEARLLPAEKAAEISLEPVLRKSPADVLAKAAVYKAEHKIAATAAGDDRSDRFVWGPGDVEITGRFADASPIP
jgi:hypothetical protein